MSWLTSRAGPHTYDPRKRVAGFVSEHGDLAEIVLDAFNTVDPLHCYYGEDINPDEYLGYAMRFIATFKADSSESKVRELFTDIVRTSFHAEQVSRGFVTEEDIASIAELIHSRIG